MHPFITNASSEMTISSPTYALGHRSSYLISPSYYPDPSLNSSNHLSYPNLSTPCSSSPSHYMNLLRTWNYHQFPTSSSSSSSTYKADSLSDKSISNYPGRMTSSFHQYGPRFEDKSSPRASFSSQKQQQQIDEEHILDKFHHETSVYLDTGESKNIQQLTTKDFLDSAQLSQHYSSLLARIEYIGVIDKLTGKVEVRFYMEAIEKTISYYVLQEMPFFVYQYSCWSSVSPEQTHKICGLKCRQLECGDQILAVTEQQQPQQKSVSTRLSVKPDYSQQSPTKCLVGRYMNGQQGSNKRHKTSNE